MKIICALTLIHSFQRVVFSVIFSGTIRLNRKGLKYHFFRKIVTLHRKFCDIYSLGFTMADDLASKVRDWLHSTGFPLEMEAAAAFRSAGFDVRQSASYADQQTDKGREIDVLATDPDELGVVRISYVVECKASSKPWVVLCSNSTLSGYNRLLAFGLTSAAARLALAERIPKRGSEAQQYVFVDSRAGYGMREALGAKDTDPAYAAAMSALKACHSLIREGDPDEVPPLCFSFPVVVVDSPVFECTLASDGSLELQQVQRTAFLFSTHVPEPIGCLVHVVTREELPTFARWAKCVATALRVDFQDKEIEAL